MTTNYQHRVVGLYLQDRFGRLDEWPFSEASEIEEELCGKRLNFAAGDYLVIDLGRHAIGKVASLEELTAFPKESLVVPYIELERACHEQHAEWIEL